MGPRSVANIIQRGGTILRTARCQAFYTPGYEARTSILGHIQRGGTPSTRDRVLASRLGFTAVRTLMKGVSGVMVGVDKRGTSTVPLQAVCGEPSGRPPHDADERVLAALEHERPAARRSRPRCGPRARRRRRAGHGCR
jgi:6-phosphofructokinase